MVSTDQGQRLPEVDLVELYADEDPYPRYAALRRAGPLVKAVPGPWVVTRHADVARLLRDSRVVHEVPRDALEFVLGSGPAADWRERSLTNRDGAAHARLRALMGQAFRASLVRELRGRIETLVDELLEPLLDRDEFDVVDDLAAPLPTQVICELLGIARGPRGAVNGWAADLASGDLARMDHGVAALRRHLEEELAGRTADAEGDLLQRMLAAESGDDSFSHEEILDNAVLLFFAGFETTKQLIAAGCDAILAHPDQRARLWADPSLAASAVEEFLRYDAPARHVYVWTAAPVEIGGHTVKAGRSLRLLLACANHDEAVFADPARLDIGRRPNPHVAFGGGAHLCLGAMLARVEGEVVFRGLASRTAFIDRAGRSQRLRGAALGSWAHVPITAVPA